MRPTLVIFGNCQAEALRDALLHHEAIADLYEIVCVRSYQITPEQEIALVNNDVRGRCTLLLEQATPSVNISGRYAFPNARICRFPSLDINLLWPLRADEPRSNPEPPEFPFGRFPYGDKVINQVVADGLSGDAGWEAFQERAITALPDIKRLAEIEQRRWAFAERGLEVQMSDIIFPKLSTQRLFWTYNHPHRLVLCRLGGRLLHVAGWAIDEDAGYEIMTNLLTWEFGADYQAPIHPKVAEALDLQWWQPDMEYKRFGQSFSYEDFIRRQIDWR